MQKMCPAHTTCLNCGRLAPCGCTEPMPAAEVYARHRTAACAGPAPADVPLQWWAGPNDEWYRIGPCATREEAIQEAVGDGMCEERSDADPEVWENRIHLVEAQSALLRLADWIDTDTALERAEESLAGSDRVSCEYDDGPWFECTPAEEADLVARLRRACDEWQAAHGLVFSCTTFSATRNAEFVVVPAVRPAPVPPAPADLEGGAA